MKAINFKALFFLSSTLFSLSTFAVEKTLGKITSDINKDYALLVYDRDETTGEVLHFFVDSYSQGVRIERKEFKETELEEGMVILKRDKYEVVRLQSSDFERNHGGTFNLDTLYSGISGERRTYRFEVLADADALRLETKNGEFNKMNFIAKRSRILGPIGIEKIQFIKE